jgi:hypothetical protein
VSAVSASAASRSRARFRASSSRAGRIDSATCVRPCAAHSFQRPHSSFGLGCRSLEALPQQTSPLVLARDTRERTGDEGE